MNAIDNPQSETPATSHNASLVIAAPAVVGRKNYLADLTVLTDTAGTLTITSLGVTIFSVALAAGMGYEKAWRRGLPGTVNGDLTIAVSGGGNFDINTVSVTA